MSPLVHQAGRKPRASTRICTSAHLNNPLDKLGIAGEEPQESA
jgi:hypothetical protein